MDTGVLYNGQALGLTTDPIQVEVPVTGANIQILPTTVALLLNATGLILALTVTLPANPVDGQRFVISSASAVTALTVTGGTVKGLITTLALNGYARFLYSATAGAWFRTG